MSEYNAKNYTGQGGDVTHIGGKLIFEEGAHLKGGIIANQPLEPLENDTVGKVRNSLNILLLKLKNSGLMKGDLFTMSVNHSVDDQDLAHADRSYNTSKITDMAVSDNVITITLSEKVSALKDFDGGGDWGIHKWLGIGVSAGLAVKALVFNGTPLTQDDVDEATAVGLESMYFVLWIKADRIIKGASNTFTLWATGFEETEIRLEIVEPDET